MPSIQIVKMPAFLATALINGDTSGLSDGDSKWLQVAIYYCAPGEIIGIRGESYFSWTCDLPGWNHFGADMADYEVIYPDV